MKRSDMVRFLFTLGTASAELTDEDFVAAGLPVPDPETRREWASEDADAIGWESE